MYKNHISLKALLIAAATTFAVSGALGATTLSAIPTLSGDTANSARAITADGKYIVGQSSLGSVTRGFLYELGSASAINVISSDNAQSTVATGIGYRTVAGVNELVVAGMSSGYVTEWMTPDGGSTWGVKRRNTAFTSNVQPAANSLGAGVGSDAYYVTSWINANGASVYLGQGTGPWVATVNYQSKGIASTDSSRMNGVSASGRAVGYRINGGIRKNYMLTWTGTTPAAVYFHGLDGTDAGQAFSVSASGNTIFGHSPITIGGTANYGYKVMNPGASQIIGALPLFGDEAGSTSIQIPYGSSADGNFAVGMAYRGTERAVFWDTTDPDPANWTVRDLTKIASDMGILDGFTRLSRAYSIGVDENGTWIIAGQGAWSDGSTRAFVMTLVPEPSALSLLALGVCGFLAARRRK